MVHSTNSVLTDDQERLVNELAPLLKSRKLMIATISGPAGSGKTFIINILDKRAGYREVAVAAPTHQAANLIGKKTGFESMTLQSLLGLKKSIDVKDFDPDDPFSFTGKPRLSNYTRVYIDEASMMNSQLHDYLVSEATIAGTQIILIGDICQMPPIEGSKYKKDNLQGLAKAFTEHEVFYLYNIVRQAANNPLSILLSLLRLDLYNEIAYHYQTIGVDKSLEKELKGAYEDSVFLINKFGKEFDVDLNKPSNFIEFWQKYPSIIIDELGYDTTKKAGFRKKSLKIFQEDLNNPEHYRILGFRRKTTHQASKIISSELDIQPYSEDSVITALDMVTRTHEDWKGRRVIDTLLYNSTSYKVIESNPEISTYGYEGNRLMLEGIGRNHTTSIFLLDIRSQYEKFNEDIVKLKDAAIKDRSNWPNYWNFLANHILPDAVETEKGIIPNRISPYFSSTTHKAQGSTYKKVGILFDDIKIAEYVVNKRDGYRMILHLLYVALSRASDFALINYNS